MYCIKCGQELVEGARFCVCCGAPVIGLDSNHESEQKEVTIERSAEGSDGELSFCAEDACVNAESRAADEVIRVHHLDAPDDSVDEPIASEDNLTASDLLVRASDELVGHEYDGALAKEETASLELDEGHHAALSDKALSTLDADLGSEDKCQKESPRVSSTEGEEKNARIIASNNKSQRPIYVLIGILIAIGVCGLAVLVSTQHMNAPSSDNVLNLEEIEDEQLRTYLLELADVDGDGQITNEEADSVTAVGSFENGEASDGLSGLNITSLKGIEKFKNVETLICRDNAIAKADLSKNMKLAFLICTDNGIEELRLPEGDTLTTLHATGNNIKSIDLSSCEGLEDIELDEGVEITGGELPNKTNQEHIEDMTLVYGVARVGNVGDKIIGDLVGSPGDSADTDAYLILRMIYPSNIVTPRIKHGQINYGFEYESTGSGYVIPLETGTAVLDAFYGTHPEDLSYIDNGTLNYTGSGWITLGADGPFTRTITTDNWFAYGKIVAFDAKIDYLDGLTGAATYTYRVVVVEDEKSAFGYHMVSMLLQDYEDKSTEFEQPSDEYSSDGDDGIIDSGESADKSSASSARKQSGSDDSHASSSSAQSTSKKKYGFNLQNILGKHVARFKDTADWYGTEHNCYAGRTAPLVINVKSLDEDRMTITYDATLVLHGHHSPKNIQDGSEGDVTVTLTDVQSRLKIGEPRVEAYVSSSDSMVTDKVTPKLYFSLEKNGTWGIRVTSVYYPTSDSSGYGYDDNYVIDLS